MDNIFQFQPELARLRKLFLINFVIGTSCLICGFLVEQFFGGLFSSWLNLALSLFFPLLVMLLYFISGRDLDKAGGATDSFADSIYYMGFLFTLIALVFALLGVGDSNGGIEGLKYRFGVALSTTIVGMVARIYLSNFRPSLSDSLTSVEMQMTKAAGALRERFETMSETLVLSTDAFHESLEVTSGDLKKASASVGSTSTAFAKRIETSGEKVGAATEGVGDKIENLFRDIDQRVADAEGRIFESIGRYTERLEELVLDPDMLSRKMEPVLDRVESKIGAFADGVENHQEQLGKIAEQNREVLRSVREALKSVESDASSTATHFGELGKASGTIKDELNGLTRSLERMKEAMESQAKLADESARSLSAVVGQAEKDVDVIRHLRSELERDLDQSREALSSVHSELISAADFIRRELK